MTVALLRAAGAAAQAGRRRTLAGGVAPTITVAPVLTWTVEIGTSPAIAPPTYTGDAGTITYTLKRNGVDVSGMVGVSEATLEAYVAVAADSLAQSAGMAVEATVTNGSGSDTDTSNAEKYDPSRTTTARLWWDPSTLSPGAVSSWVDRIASIAAAQATGTKQPVMSTTSLNSAYPGVTADAGDVLVASTSAVLSGKTSMTVTMAVKDVDTAVKVILELTATFTANNGAISIFVNDVSTGRLSAACRGSSGGAYRYISGGGADLATPIVLSVGFDLTASGVAQVVFIRLNGSAQTLSDSTNTSTAGSLSADPLYIFGRSTGPTLGSLATIGNLVFREAHSQGNGLESIERYVGAKAGITW